MGKLTILDKFFWRPICYLEYRIAKHWLDSNFGEREYWGSYIAELMKKTNTN